MIVDLRMASVLVVLRSSVILFSYIDEETSCCLVGTMITLYSDRIELVKVRIDGEFFKRLSCGTALFYSLKFGIPAALNL